MTTPNFPYPGRIAVNTLKSGLWYPNEGGGGNRTMTYNLLWMIPFDSYGNITIQAVNYNVLTAGTAGSTIRLLMYNSDRNGFVGGLNTDFGTFAGDATGIKGPTGLTLNVGPARFWLGAVWQGTNTLPPILQGTSRVISNVGWTAFIQNPPVIGYQYNAISGAGPATLGNPSGFENNLAVGIQFQTL